MAAKTGCLTSYVSSVESDVTIVSKPVRSGQRGILPRTNENDRSPVQTLHVSDTYAVLLPNTVKDLDTGKHGMVDVAELARVWT